MVSGLQRLRQHDMSHCLPSSHAERRSGLGFAHVNAQDAAADDFHHVIAFTEVEAEISCTKAGVARKQTM
jgi:hypothetical protein